MNDKSNKKIPLVSIIMNCYNGEAYLKESIESILSQTYKNWELIFWDNLSKDNSAKVLKNYKDERLKYFISEKHTPLYEARNLAIEKSEGEYIAFLDTDDIWVKNKLELQMKYFFTKDVGVVFSNLWIAKKDLKKKKLYEKNIFPRGNIYKSLIKKYNIGIITAVIKKQYYEKLGKKFDERFSIIGDFDLFLRLAKICLIESIQEPLAFYRLHGKNLSNLNKFKEIEESELWLEENNCKLDYYQIENIRKQVLHRKFVNCKIDGKYRECIKIIIRQKISLYSIKNLIILFTPIIILKKIFWYHQG
jgi:glycosyltransferase involved in cell wall biosynthesis